MKIEDSINAAYLEFEKEPMDDYYTNFFVGYFSRLRVKKVLKELGYIKDKKVLDVGCEAGYVSLKLMERGAQVIPFDICVPAIQKFKSKAHTKIPPFVAIAQQMPLKPETVDAIVATEVIEHMPDVEKVFEEMHRVLKKQGILVITFPNEGLRKKVYWLVKLFGIDTDVEKDVTLFEYSKEQIVQKLKKYFKIRKTYTIPRIFALTNLMVVEK